MTGMLAYVNWSLFAAEISGTMWDSTTGQIVASLLAIAGVGIAIMGVIRALMAYQAGRTARVWRDLAATFAVSAILVNPSLVTGILRLTVKVVEQLLLSLADIIR